MKRLAIILTHPIQYYAPVFKLLAERKKIEITVFYTWGEASVNKHDPGFQQTIAWDIPLLEGYPWQWVENKAANPGSHHFNGIVNPNLIHQVNQIKPDAVLIFGWAYHSHLKAIRKFKNKIPIFFRGDSTLLDSESGPKSFLRTIILKWIYRHIDHAFYVGENNKAYFKKYGLTDMQLTFAPHAIDNERFGKDRLAEALALRRQLLINDDDLLVLFAGKLEEKKDPLLLLHAFAQLNMPGTHLLYVGNGPLEAKLKAEAKQYNNIHFVDFKNQSQMPMVYQCSNLFCLPSKGPGETWGLTINEAMACGKAILASDKVGSVPDLVKEGVNGHIFKAGDVEDLETKLGFLLSNKEQLKAYGKKSKEIIADWTFTNIAVAIENKLLNKAN